MKRTSLALMIAAAAFTAGCGKDGDSATTPMAGTKARHNFSAIEHRAPLSRALPETTLAYVRIPSLNDLLFAPKGDGLTEVQSSDAMQEVSKDILRGVVDNVVGVLAEPQTPLADLLATRLLAPIEMAFVESPVGSVTPDVLIRTVVTETSTDELATMMQGLAANAYFVQPFDDEGNATLMAGPSPAYMNYDSDSGVLKILSGFSATAEQLAALTDGSTPSTNAVAAIETPLDASGRGMSIWINLERWWPALKPMVPPSEMPVLDAIGMDQMESLWLGSVSKDGRSETQLRITMPVSGFRTLMPPPEPMTEIDVAPEVQWAGRLHVPSEEELDAIVGWAAAMAPEARGGFDEMNAKVQETMGIELGDFLGPGGDAIFVSDAAGWWSWGDGRTYAKVRDALGSRDLMQATPRSLGGVDMEELRFDFMSLVEENEDIGPEAEVFARFRGRTFLAPDGDGYLVADVPQVLARREAANRVPLTQWTDALGLDWTHASFAFAGTLDGSPIKIYDTYLTALGYVASVADVPIDLTRFPVMPYPGVPDAGRIGIQVDSTVDYLALRLQYETSAVEMMFGSGYESVAVAGILLAIAIPAYQDYTVRAKLSMEINSGAAAKMAIAEYYFSNETLPDPDEANSLFETSGLVGIFMDEDGDIAITISGVDPLVDGGTVWISPVLEDDGLSWSCFSDIDSKYLPVDCR